MPPVSMFCLNPKHRALVLVEDAKIVTFIRKGGKTGYRYSGVCPNDGTKISKIAPSSVASESAVGSGIPTIQVQPPMEQPRPTTKPLLIPTTNSIELMMANDPNVEQTTKLLSKFMRSHPQQGAGLESLFISMLPGLIPMIPDLIRGISGIFGNGIGFPSNRPIDGRGVEFPSNRPIGSGLTGPYNSNETAMGGKGLRNPVKDLEEIARRMLSK